MAGVRGAKRLRGAIFLAIGLAMTGFVLVAYGTNLMRPLELAAVDARFDVRGDVTAPELVVVAIDDKTFDDLDTRWPFPRSFHAHVVEALSEAGARVIAYDIQFTEPSEDAEADNALVDAVAHAEHVVLATTEVDEQGGTAIFGGDDVLHEIGARPGNALLPADSGGVIRRVPYEVEGLVAFAVAAAEEALGRPVAPDALGGESTWIDFRGPPGTIEAVSFSDVLEGRVDESRLRDRIVVVGPVAPSLQDVHATATSGEEFMSGAEIQANAIWTALHGFPLRSTPEALTLGLIALFGLLPPLAGMRLSLRYGLLLSVLAAAGFLVLAQVAFERGHVLTVAYPLAALALSTVGSVAAHYTVAAFDRARVRDIFGRFVPEQVVDQVLAQAGGDLRLGGRTLDATVMFTDIRGFTSFSEHREADEIDVINRFLEGMTSAVLGQGGTLVSFTGDGFMAVFGAPLEQPDHADRALAAAREMRDRELPSFNAWLSERGLGDGFRLGIGLNSGAIMAGNVGSQQRLEYTVMGDVVNVASRVEGLTKGTPHMLLLTETTRDALVRPPDDLVYVDEAEVRGRHAKIGIWSVDGAAPAAQSEA